MGHSGLCSSVVPPVYISGVHNQLDALFLLPAFFYHSCIIRTNNFFFHLFLACCSSKGCGPFLRHPSRPPLLMFCCCSLFVPSGAPLLPRTYDMPKCCKEVSSAGAPPIYRAHGRCMGAHVGDDRRRCCCCAVTRCCRP